MSELLLTSCGTIQVPATTTPFIAAEHFVRNIGDDASVKISFIGDNFQKWFLGKQEEPFVGSTVRYGMLTRRSVDTPIITELGGPEKAETTLTELFFLMSKQPRKEEGTLLTNGYANIFYIKDVEGVLRAVSVRWRDDGWRVHAYAVENPSEWREGSQVFSRNSC